MKETRILMGMPIAVEIIDQPGAADALEKVYACFDAVDQRFSTYKETSEITRINRGAITQRDCSPEMRDVLVLCEETKRLTDGYFDIRRPDGTLDPSGLVKGWSIQRAATLLTELGMRHFFIEAGGDIQVHGRNAQGEPWRIGIRNPFATEEIVKVLTIEDRGVATSGTYIRGQHIYNPHRNDESITDIVSLTVVGPNIYEADRFATAAFAMGKAGIRFIERLDGFAGYMIDAQGIATMTPAFASYVR